MIRLIFGNVGSGKSASMVNEMISNPHNTYLTNIKMYDKRQKHIKQLKPEMIIKKEVVKEKKDGTPVYSYKLNTDFWKNIHNKYSNINVVIDEAHIFFNPRRSMSSINIIMTDFLALLRRVLGTADNTGDLILITQLQRRLDIIAKEMANDIVYYKDHYVKVCTKCNANFYENNETADKIYNCEYCGNYRLKKVNHVIEGWKFTNLESYKAFAEFGDKSYYKHFIIRDIEKVFSKYDTLQWDDMFSSFIYN